MHLTKLQIKVSRRADVQLRVKLLKLQAFPEFHCIRNKWYLCNKMKATNNLCIFIYSRTIKRPEIDNRTLSFTKISQWLLLSRKNADVPTDMLTSRIWILAWLKWKLSGSYNKSLSKAAIVRNSWLRCSQILGCPPFRGRWFFSRGGGRVFVWWTLF
jgi:hypothetical protein